ncbi:chitin deacetylase-like 5 isoform X5 [Rhynchophorus ferrugineus]|uniref:chitin deacetylase-like 5 isoform X5 n=1 Tax=Rhynchophorus ferrugineus TaxID=354439 RepID=UPI003FCCDA0C
MIPKFIFATVLLSIFLDAEAQRKLSRPLPTLAETKGRERANFDCPEEFGYYPHPTDCTQYYVCVFGGALLESCTGGLMYSHELQTCDWPRNVGCDGLELPASAPSSSSSSGSQQVRSKERLREKDDSKSEQRIKYAPPAPPPPPQPRAVVTSRGQPRQLQTQQEIIKQPLYADVEDALPPAEEIESDRQQRVYRGQPSTIGQVQRDRDGYRHTNSLSSRGEKVEVISFGTQSQLQPYSDEKSSISPSISTTTATARAIYNNSQYNHVHNNDNRYDPYYALYDDDVELYKDVDYTPQNHYNTQQQTKSTTANVYRGSTVSAVRDETPKRGSIPYNSVSQDIYQPSTVSDYGESSYQDDENTYRQSSRGQNSLRGDRNEINDIEEIPTTKRITTTTRKLTTTTTRTTTTQARTLSTKKSITASPRTPSRGRGTSHYSNGSGSGSNNEATATVNRGTPATRSRPTLKPSTSIVSKAAEYVDIYRFPPIRPEPIYPQPQPDKTAAKCRKDVCLLPDCYCGGKDIPGNIPVDQTPQMVLMTFDDAVNDLNKEYYYELFENGRKNPNGCPISATFYVSHEWTDYSQVQNLYADGHEFASHTVSHSFGEQFSQKKWTREVAGQREILAAYGGVKMEDVRGMRAPFLSVGGNKMFKMLYDSNFTYDSSMPIYENKPPSWPYTLDYKLFHDCMIPPCPTRSYPGVWEVPMVMWQDLNGGRCSMGDACSNPPDADGVYKMLLKNFERHYTTNRAPFGLFYHAAWFTQPHHKEGFINFIDTVLAMKDVWFITNWQAIQWVRDPTPSSRLNSFQPFQCNYSDRPKRCNNPKVCNLWHKSGVRYMRTCQPCPDIYPWTGNTGIRSSRIDNDIED